MMAWEEELHALLQDRLEGEWDADKQSALEAMLMDSADARTLYRRIMETHAMLDIEHRGSANVAAPVVAAEPDPTPIEDPRRAFGLHYLMLAAAAVFLIGLTVFQNSSTKPQPTEGDGATYLVAGVAQVELIEDVQWAQDGMAVELGSRIGKRWLEMKSGVVGLRFADGSRVSIQGPAAVSIEEIGRIQLAHGEIVVRVDDATDGFTVKTPDAVIRDLGTEFGVAVAREGGTQMQVIEGLVEMSIPNVGDAPMQVQAGSAVSANQGALTAINYDDGRFASLRPGVVWQRKKLKLQFDCGTVHGLYRGTNSPGHATSDFGDADEYWNELVGDRSGFVIASDGGPAPTTLDIDVGATLEHSAFSWDEQPKFASRAAQGPSIGVFDTPLGLDSLRAGKVGIRLRGLPVGRYRLYLMARSNLVWPNRGNYLAEKAFAARVAVEGGSEVRHPMDMLTDPTGSSWVPGETHAVVEIEIAEPEQAVSIFCEMDRQASTIQPGGSGEISGLQIIQLD